MQDVALPGHRTGVGRIVLAQPLPSLDLVVVELMVALVALHTLYHVSQFVGVVE